MNSRMPVRPPRNGSGTTGSISRDSPPCCTRPTSRTSASSPCPAASPPHPHAKMSTRAIVRPHQAHSSHTIAASPWPTTQRGTDSVASVSVITTTQARASRCGDDTMGSVRNATSTSSANVGRGRESSGQEARKHHNHQEGHAYNLEEVMNIYVTNLTYSTTEEELSQLFEPYGIVESARIITDRDTGRSRGFGFVEMHDTTEDAQAHA